MSTELLHHLYQDPARDLVPFCGVITGRDPETGVTHAGHDRDTLLDALHFGLPCCITCLSPEALGGFTPLILSDVGEDDSYSGPDAWSADNDVPVWRDDDTY